MVDETRKRGRGQSHQRFAEKHVRAVNEIWTAVSCVLSNVKMTTAKKLTSRLTLEMFRCLL